MDIEKINEAIDYIDEIIKAVAKLSCSIEEKKLLVLFLMDVKKKLLYGLTH
jgi:hypothetical protein